MNKQSYVVLRPMVETDLPMVLEWRNLDGVRKNMYTSHVISPEEHRNWWNCQCNNPRTRLLVASLDHRDVGVVIFTDYTGKRGVATWAFYAGNVAEKGVGSMMEAAALEYAFSELELRKLECEVLDFNMPVVNLHLRHGFMVEGIFRKAYQRDETLHDIYRLALFAEDWKKHIAPMIRESGGGRFGLAGKSFSRVITVTEKMIDAFGQATGDYNPVHFDDSYATSIGFPGRIAHGMLSGSLFSAFFASDFPGEGTVYLSQRLDFLKPVPVKADLELRIKVLAQVGRRLTLETQGYLNGELCLNGQAVLLAPKGMTN